MIRLVTILVLAISLSGCELLKPVTAKEAKAEAGLYSHRTDIGGGYRSDNGDVVVVPRIYR